MKQGWWWEDKELGRWIGQTIMGRCFRLVAGDVSNHINSPSHESVQSNKDVQEMEGLGVKEVGEHIKTTDDAMKDDMKGDLKQKPVGNASKQEVQEDITGSSP